MLLLVKGNQDAFDELSLADKINLKSKFKGFLSDVDMTDREFAILKYLSKASSFDDVLVRSLFLYKLMTSEKDVNQMSQKDINDLMQDANAPDGFEDLESLDELDKQSILDNRACDAAEASGDSSPPDESGDAQSSNIEDIMSDMQDASSDAPDNDSKVKTSEVGTSPKGSTNCKYGGESKTAKLFADQLSNIAGHKKIIMHSWTI